MDRWKEKERPRKTDKPLIPIRGDNSFVVDRLQKSEDARISAVRGEGTPRGKDVSDD